MKTGLGVRQGRKFSPCIPRWRGSPCNRVSALGVKKLEWWGYRAEKKFDDIFSRLDTMHQRDRRTDGRTPGDCKDPAYAYRRAAKTIVV